MPKVIKKNENQKQRIRKRLSEAFMFSVLDNDETEIVINSMEEMNFKYFFKLKYIKK